jgi:hypothetical protein
MAEGKKMALVPLDMLQQWKNHPTLTALKNPNQNQLLKTMNQMETILNDNSLPENIKSNRVSETLKDYSVYADKIMPHRVENPPVADVLKQNNNDFFDSLPKTFQNSAKNLMNELKKHPETISWNPQNNEVSINGKMLAGSNIVDLIGDVLRNRKTVPSPLHSDIFLKLLANLNVPEELVKNRLKINKLRTYKHNAPGENQVERAVNKVLQNKRKFGKNIGHKLIRKKKHKWLTM